MKTRASSIVDAADPTANVVTDDGCVGISTTRSPLGGRATIVRPWASTPHVDERSTTATGCCGSRTGRQRWNCEHDRAGDPQLGCDVERHIGDDASVDQRVTVDLDRREDAGEGGAGDDCRDDITRFEDEGASGRKVRGNDRQRGRRVLDQSSSEVLAQERDAVPVVEERRSLARQGQRRRVPDACATGLVV